MHFTDLSPHIHFLNDAAHLLSRSAPETSAFLMSRRNELLVAHDIPLSDAQRQHVCSACGHILVPGQQDTTLTIESEKAPPRSKSKKKAARAAAAAAAAAAANAAATAGTQKTASTPTPAAVPQTRAMPGGISKVLTCGSCARKTRCKLEGPKRISRVRKASMAQPSKVSSDGGRTLQTVAEPVKSSANANSKKRAKNRKAGLQALLDQKQGAAASSSSSGFGLSLSDFMMKK